MPGSTGAAPAPAASDSPRPSSSSARLLETEVVTGPGADAFAGSTVLGADEDGAGGTPLSAPEPEPPKPPTTPQEAAMIGRAVAAFCKFGWRELASRNEAELAVMLPANLSPAMLIEGGGEMVAASAANLAMKYNVRIPWGDELVVGLGCSVSVIGIVGKFRGQKDAANDNAGHVTHGHAGGDGHAAASSPAAAAARAAGPIEDAELVEDVQGEAAAYGDGKPVVLG